ncbi:MAG: DUF6624 domain-containing protein [Kofleriaceae bacterium]
MILAACGGGAPSPPARPAPAPAVTANPPTEAEANAAYKAKQYGKCARTFEAVAVAVAPGARKDLLLYSAACCHALDARPDLALGVLERAAAAGMRNHAELRRDPDLATLHGDARWPALIAKVEAAAIAWEQTLKEPALRRELLAMMKEDQDARFEAMRDKDNKVLAEAMEAVDRRTTARMKAIITEHGWPGKRLVGEDGTNAAWVLVQHADRDPAFQKLCLTKLEPLVATGEVTAANYGYLFDRIAVAEHRHQRYGTQFTSEGEPSPMEDPANVDARRKAIGLGTMAEYKVLLRAMNSRWDRRVPRQAK